MSSEIVLSGGASSIGRALIPLLHNPGNSLTVVDPRMDPALLPEDVTLLKKNLNSSSVRNLARSGIDVWIHIGIQPPAGQEWQWLSEGTQVLVDLVSEAKIPVFIYVSTAMVYGAFPDNPQLIAEDWPLRAARHSRIMAPYVEGDLAVSTLFWKAPQTRVVLLRPSFILGPSDGLFARYLRNPAPPMIMGMDPMVSPLHLYDLTQVVTWVLTSDVRGIFNLRGSDILPLSRLLDMAGRSPLVLPLGKMAETIVPGLSPYLKFVCIGDDSLLITMRNYRSFSLTDMITDALTPQLSLVAQAYR